MNTAKEAKLQNTFGSAVSLLPAPSETKPPEEMTYPHAARRYLLSEPDLSYPENVARMDAWFISVVASWIDDVGLDEAMKAMKKESREQINKHKPPGKHNWMEKISRGEYTDLPEQLQRDEVMYLVVCANDARCNFELMPEDIERRGRFSPQHDETGIGRDDCSLIA